MRSRLLAVAAGTVALLAAPIARAGYAPGCTVFFPDGVSSEFRDVAIQPDGRVVAVGYLDDGINRDFLVARFHPDLSLDTTFNGGFGYIQVNFDTHDEAYGVAIQTDGKIVAVGYSENNGGSKRFLAIMRLLPDGTFDPAFVGGGGIIHDLVGGSAQEELHAVALQPDGKIVVAGYHTAGGVKDVLVGRFLNDGISDGNWDTSFDLDGFAQPILAGSTTTHASDLVVAPDGNIVVSATGTFSGDDDFVALRFRTDGTLDPIFGSNAGWERTDIGAIDDLASSITLEPNGNITLAGSSNFDFAVVRYRANGTLEPAFSGGIVTHHIGADRGRASALDGAGRAVLVGRGGAQPDLALTRFTPTGSVDLSVAHDILGEDEALALRIRKDGKLLTAGLSQGPVSPRATLALYNPDGSQDCGELALHPTDFGFQNDFTPVSCADNWDCVNDQPTNAAVEFPASHDGVGTYVLSPTPARVEYYQLTPPALPAGTVVTSIEIVAYVSWSGAGVAPSAELFYQRLGFDAARVRGGTLPISSTIFQEVRHLWTDLNWNQTELDNLEIGIDHVTGDDLRMTQMYVIVKYGEPLVHPVDAFTAAATGVGVNGQVTLNWLNPSFGKYDETVIRRDTAGCPASPSAGQAVVNQSDGLGQTGTFVDSASVGTTYHYVAFVEDAENHFSPGKCLVASPIDRTAVQVDWVYSTSDPIAALATPGLKISTNTVYTTTNDGVVHAMTGGDAASGGGSWPSGWKPFRIGAAAPSRPPIVELWAGTWAALFGSKDGRVYAVNAATGALVWQSPKLGAMISSSPAAILTAFGGGHDLVFVGTRNSGQANRLYALNARDGTVEWHFDNGGPPSEIGMITSGPAVSYVDERVYFTSFAAGSGKSLWCLDFASGSPLQCGSWTDFGVSVSSGGDVASSPILFNGFVYVSDNTLGANLDEVSPADGFVNLIQFLGGNGARDYVFPRFGTTDVIVSTANEILSVETVSKSLNWTPFPLSMPSAPLFVIGTDDIYVGGGDGKLHRVSASSGGPGTTECIGDCSTTIVGSPAYDFSRLMIYLGTDEGKIYGVKTPF